MPEHVRVDFEPDLCRGAGARYQAREAGRGKRRATFGHEHEWRLCLALQCPQRAHLFAEQWMRGAVANLSSPHVEGRGLEFHVAPLQVAKF
jgi:hypothetical protein